MVQLKIEDDTRTWRDVADQLPAEMVAQLERAEELGGPGKAKPWECSPADSDALMLHFGITKGIEEHQAGVRFADVPTPQWVMHAGPWQNAGTGGAPEWSRVLEGPRYTAVGELGQVLVSGTQDSEGAIEWGLMITGDCEDQLQPDSARKLAAALVEAATFLECVDG